MFIGYLLQDPKLDLSCPGGPQLHVTSIVKGLCNRGHRVRLVQLAEQSIKWSDDLENWHIVPYSSCWRPLIRLLERPIRLAQTLLPFLPYFNYFDSLRFADTAGTVLKGIDCLYERHIFMAYGGALLSQRWHIPLLLEINGIPFDEAELHGILFSGIQYKVSHWVTKQTIAHASKVVPSGYGWEKRLIDLDLLSFNHSVVIWPAASDIALLPSHNPLQNALKKQWGLNGKPLIVFEGGFYAWQGLRGLIQAFALVLQELDRAQLVLIGDGPLREEIELLANETKCTGRVIFTGRLPYEVLMELLKMADIGVLLYERRAEFVGMKLFDYMATQTIPIVTAPERKHDLIQNGVNGIVIEPGNMQQLAEAILLVGRELDHYQSMRMANRQFVEQEHTWERRCENIERLALTLVKQKQVA